jgi:hypothetical protein
MNAPGGCGCVGAWGTKTVLHRRRGFLLVRGRVFACRFLVAAPEPYVEEGLFLLLAATLAVDLCWRILAALLAARSFDDRDRATRG